MNGSCSSVAIKMGVNPFATRYVAPGRVPWIDPGNAGIDDLVNRFRALGSRAAVVGKHGTGKSTLLEHLVPKLGRVVYRCDFQGNMRASTPPVTDQPNVIESRNCGAIAWVGLRGRRSIRVLQAGLKRLSAGDLLVVDGFEQLSTFQRMRVRWLTRRSRLGLLVTCHRDLGLPCLHQTRVSPQLALAVVSEVCSLVGETTKLEQSLVLELLGSERGNLREVMMRLYDEFESN